MPTQAFDKTLVIEPAPKKPDSVDEPQATLTVLCGNDLGAVHVLSQAESVLGRGPTAQISLDDDGASRRHCQIVRAKDGYVVEDLGSTNGVYVDGVRIGPPVLLAPGARVQIGNTIMRFALLDALEREAARSMYEMSVHDGLTGVFNRRYLEERITSEFAFAFRHKTALCVLLVDIDHFKRINDTYGHAAGDYVLRSVANSLKAGIRTEDVVARYGGEEFAIIARGVDVPGARAFAERVRVMIERTHIAWEGQRIAVTASVGLSHNHAASPAARPEALVADADTALYAAKRAGRNRVEVAQSPGRYSSQEGNVDDVTSSPRVAERVAAGGAIQRAIKVIRSRQHDQPTASVRPKVPTRR